MLGQARLRQAEFDILLRFLGREWIEMTAEDSVLLQPLQIQRVQRRMQFRTAGQDGLEQLDLIIVQAGKMKNFVQDVRGQVVRVVHDQRDRAPFSSLLET